MNPLVIIGLVIVISAVLLVYAFYFYPANTLATLPIINTAPPTTPAVTQPLVTTDEVHDTPNATTPATPSSTVTTPPLPADSNDTPAEQLILPAFVQSGLVQYSVERIYLGQRTTWSEASNYASKQGELMKTNPLFAEHWVPISDAVNEWFPIDKGTLLRASTYSGIYGKLPSWGQSIDSYPGRGWIIYLVKR